MGHKTLGVETHRKGRRGSGCVEGEQCTCKTLQWQNPKVHRNNGQMDCFALLKLSSQSGEGGVRGWILYSRASKCPPHPPWTRLV